MGHLPAKLLHKWKSGDQLFATQLTENFATLHELTEAAADLAVTPDPAGTEALQRVARAERRIAAIEHWHTATARELGQREYTPLARFGALVLHVNALADPLHKAAADLAAEVTRRTDAEASLEARLALVESTLPPPPAPSLAQFEALQAELVEARESAAAFDYQARRLRTEVAQLRADIEQRDAAVADAQQAAHEVLRERMDAFEASTAAADVAEMRAEVARMQRLIEDTDRREALQRFFTPRAMAAFMLKRLERVEAKLR